MRGIQLFALTFLSFLVLFSTALALDVYIRPAKMVVRMNTTDVYNGTLEVKNTNNVTVNVTFKPTGEIADKIFLTKDFEILNPNETKKVNFEIRVKEPGNYTGTVLVTYFAPDTPGIGLQAEIIILAQGPAKKKEPAKNNLELYAAAIIAALVLIAVAVAWKKSKGKTKRHAR